MIASGRVAAGTTAYNREKFGGEFLSGRKMLDRGARGSPPNSSN
jgi:hypothetical protein